MASPQPNQSTGSYWLGILTPRLAEVFHTIPKPGEFGIDNPSGWIERFGIDPDFRGRDLGKQMFNEIVSHFRAEGAATVRTLADGRETGVVGFLKALGFAPSVLQALEIPLD